LRPDAAGGGADDVVVQDPEEMTQQDVLGVHGDVGLEFALPPAVGFLAVLQVGTGQGDGLGHAPFDHQGICLGHADVGRGALVFAGGTGEQRHDSRSTA
jgi:hypothetical protein